MKRLIIKVFTVIIVAAWSAINELIKGNTSQINGKLLKKQKKTTEVSEKQEKEEPSENQEEVEIGEEYYEDQYERNKGSWYITEEYEELLYEDEIYAREWKMFDGKVHEEMGKS